MKNVTSSSRAQTVSINYWLLSLQLDVWMLGTHSGLDHWSRGRLIWTIHFCQVSMDSDVSFQRSYAKRNRPSVLKNQSVGFSPCAWAPSSLEWLYMLLVAGAILKFCAGVFC